MKPEAKENMKRILNITMWCLLVSGLLVCLGFVENDQNSLICRSLNININDDDEMFFVQKEDIKQLLKSRGDAIIDQPVRSINIPQIEKVVNSHPSVESAEVYMDVNGGLNIDITQRKPLVRIINDSNETYYIDTGGKLMLLSDNYSARVLVANGKIHEPYAQRHVYSIDQIEKRSGAKDSTILDDVFELAKYITKDAFWKAQIQQLYVNDNREFEMIPRVGDHVILFGDASDIDEKFHKLMTFYNEAMNKTGWWNNYSVINLKYKGQVVCTRREENPILYAWKAAYAPPAEVKQVKKTTPAITDEKKDPKPKKKSKKKKVNNDTK